jgi:CubicO group peptidase (beta-lactamase class C family)
MLDTRIKLTPEQAARLAPPYDRSLAPSHNWDLDALAGAGALRSTADDMLKFLEAALADDEDGPVGRDIRSAWEKRAEGGPGGIGLNWFLAGDGVSRWHNGQTGGYSSSVFVYPPQRKAVVVLCNTATELTTVLGEKILQAMLGMDVAPVDLRTEVAVDAATLESYVGVYAFTPTVTITITLEDGRLMEQVTGQSKYPLFAESPTKFFLKVVDAQISFVVEGGKVTKLILHQGGLEQPAMRVER